jgi:hypothetical protein
MRNLPIIKLTPNEFRNLSEYSCSIPTGTTPGKRWKRLDGSHDQEFIARGGKPKWQIGEFDPNCPPDAKHIKIFWYRPVISIRAASAGAKTNG